MKIKSTCYHPSFYPELQTKINILQWNKNYFDFLPLITKLLYVKTAQSCIFVRAWTVFILTHWGRVTHICISKLTIIGPDNGLSPGRRQTIIWTNDGILLIGPLGTNFSKILIEIYIFSFKKMLLKMSSGNWQPFCLGLNVLTHCETIWQYNSASPLFQAMACCLTTPINYLNQC